MLDFEMLIPDLSLDSPSYFAMQEEEEYYEKQKVEHLIDDAFGQDENDDNFFYLNEGNLF